MFNLYVMPYKGVWAVKKEAEEEPESVHETKEEAILKAKEDAADENHIVILSADGSIENSEAYSIEPLIEEDEQKLTENKKEDKLMYFEFPHNNLDKGVLEEKIDKYVSELLKKGFPGSFKVSDIQRTWNNHEMIFSFDVKQGFLERKIQGFLNIKDRIVIIEFDAPDIIKNFVREDKLKAIISNHLDSVLNEVSYAE